MIVRSVAYRNGTSLGDVELDQISEVLKDPGTFLWVGLYEPEESMLRRVQHEFGLHDLAVEDALHAHQRPKIEAYGETLFLSLVTVRSLDDDTLQFGETHVFLGPNFIVTVRHGASAAHSTLREKCEAAPNLLAKGPTYVLYAILDFIVDHHQEVAEQMEDRFEVLEGEIFNDRFDRAAIARFYAFKRQLMRLRAAALPVEDICAQLVHIYEKHVPKDLRAYFRDVADHTARTVGSLDGLREMLTTAIQVNLSLVTVAQNEVVKRLAGWGAVLAIPTIVFSLYGMNFQWMPELKWPYAYPVVVGVTAAACIALYVRLRKGGYL
ncbi:MAG: magnesium and cobalt transport protein CorA [Janthinobacterium lividum]